MAGLPGTAFAARCATYNIYTIKQAKKAIRTALQTQLAGAGFSLVEFLSACPTNWKMTPQEALLWVEQIMTDYYPLGIYIDTAS